MTKSIVLILFMLISFEKMLTAQINQEELYKSKVNSFTKMRNTGMIITAAGGLLTIAGVGYMIKGDRIARESDELFDMAGLEEQLTGILLLCVGTGAGITGSVLWTIGSTKKNQYKEKQSSVSLNFTPDPRKALTLSLRF